MQIISGEFGGRSLKTTLGANYRPVTGRVRSGIFSSLSSKINFANLSVLDLYAGTGSLGFEAISRGAKTATFVDNNPKHIEWIKESAKNLNIVDRIDVIVADVFSLSNLYNRTENNKTFHLEDGFDLIFADPPYNCHPGQTLLKFLIDSNLAKIGSRVILTAEKNTDVECRLVSNSNFSLKVDNTKHYSRTNVSFLTVKHHQEEEEKIEHK